MNSEALLSVEVPSRGARCDIAVATAFKAALPLSLCEHSVAHPSRSGPSWTHSQGVIDGSMG